MGNNASTTLTTTSAEKHVAPVDPAPVETEPVDPASVETEPVDPASVETAPVNTTEINDHDDNASDCDSECSWHSEMQAVSDAADPWVHLSQKDREAAVKRYNALPKSTHSTIEIEELNKFFWNLQNWRGLRHQ